MNYSFPLGSKVALKDGYDKLYTRSVSGQEGWIRKHKIDVDEFPLIWVEWDKDHWRYSGQIDGWTFESHFQMVEGPGDNPHEEASELADFLTELMPEVHAQRETQRIDSFVSELGNALQTMSDSDAFLAIAVRRITNPDDETEIVFVPEIYQATLSDELSLILEAQLASCAAQAFRSLVSHLIDPPEDEE